MVVMTVMVSTIGFVSAVRETLTRIFLGILMKPPWNWQVALQALLFSSKKANLSGLSLMEPMTFLQGHMPTSKYTPMVRIGLIFTTLSTLFLFWNHGALSLVGIVVTLRFTVIKPSLGVLKNSTRWAKFSVKLSRNGHSLRIRPLHICGML